MSKEMQNTNYCQRYYRTIWFSGYWKKKSINKLDFFFCEKRS